MIRKPNPTATRSASSWRRFSKSPGSPSQSKPWLWQGKVLPALWTLTSLISMTINVILLAVLILVGRQLFAIKGLVENGLIGGLHKNFVLMDQAHIITNIQVVDTIQVIDQIPIRFDLPLNQDTVVKLVEDVSIPNTTVYLNNTPIKTTVVLPQGTPLNITLNLSVPVSQTIPVVLNVPVSLNVPVDIPLDQTELHEPFVGLRAVVEPYQTFLGELPDSWPSTPFCGRTTLWLCNWLFDLK